MKQAKKNGLWKMVWLFKKNKFTDISFSSLPGILSIILSIISIPIFLENLETELYSSYILSHLLLSTSLIFNMNIGKITSIKIQKLILKEKKKLITNAIVLSFALSLFFSLLASLIFYKIFLNQKYLNFSYIFIGIFMSTMFVNFEFINKGLNNFKSSAICNLLFYGGSISLPAFLLKINFNFSIKENIFLISILIKIISLVLIFIILNKKNFINLKNLNLKVIKSFQYNSYWMTISNLFNQVYDYFDKYLIKIFLTPLNFINYSISQQIASKITIFSQAFISVLLPNLASQKKIRKRMN